MFILLYAACVYHSDVNRIVKAQTLIVKASVIADYNYKYNFDFRKVTVAIVAMCMAGSVQRQIVPSRATETQQRSVADGVKIAS